MTSLRMNKAFIYLTVTTAFLSGGLLFTLHRSTVMYLPPSSTQTNHEGTIIFHKEQGSLDLPGTESELDNSQRLRNKPRDHFSNEQHLITTNSYAPRTHLKKSNNSQIIRTRKRKPKEKSITTHDKQINSSCLPIRVVLLRGNWLDAPTEGYSTQKCAIPCQYTSDSSKTTLEHADAAVVYVPDYSGDPHSMLKQLGVNPNKVLKVAMSMESTRAHPHQFDYLSNYDIEMTFRMSSDVPDPYFTFARGKQNLLEETNSTWESREKAVLFVARNCQSANKREQLVEMLQKHVRVDSVSGCLHNKDWPADIPRKNKRALLRRYLVLLAAENSIEEDYVTEKAYAGLITGAVPVYYGAPNVDDFVPSHSIIKVPHPLSEKGVAEVAEKIKLVFNSKEEYERLTSFKRHSKYEDRFLARFNFTRTGVTCRLCQKILSLKCGDYQTS